MDFHSKLSLFVFLAVSFAICHGQFENMGMLALAGGFGGGGMGMGGNAFNTGLGLAGSEMTPAEYAMLDNTVKSVVGPHASPDIALLTYARSQGATPSNMFQMTGYIPYLQNIARTVGIQPTTGSGPTSTGTNQTQSIDDVIMQRAVQWMQQNLPMVSPAATLF